MRRESWIALGVSLVLGVLAVYLANVFLSRSEVRTEAAVAGTTKVAVAAVPLDYGVEVTAEKVRFVSFPTASLPAGSYRTLNDLLPAGKRRVALRPMQPNELILASKITGEGQGASIASLLPDGKRAAAVRLNDVSGVAGFVQPNDSVDVLVTRQAGGEGGNARQVTDVLLQNIRIIAIDQTTKNPDGTPAIAKTATLEVEPIDAQKLALAQQVGSLSLVLRKPGEEQNNPLVETVSLEDLRYSIYGGARYGGGGGYGQALAAGFAPARARVSMAATRPAAPVSVRRTTQPGARPVRPANTNSVEIVRGTKGESYVVGVYGAR